MVETARIDRALREVAANVPGVVAMATTATGTIYEGAFGLRDMTRDTKMSLDTTFFYASMTKALASVAAMQMVEQGKLSLDGPITDVLPEIADPQVLEGFTADGAPILRPAASAITLRQLLAHSAGYGNTAWNPELGRYFTTRNVPAVATSWEHVRRTPLLFDPGTRWNYSIGTALVGKAVEAVSGQRLDLYWRDHVTGPLGMRDTTVLLSDEQRARMASPHARQADGSLARTEYPHGHGPSFMMGGGALCGTAGDYLRFTRMMLNRGALDGARLLRPETVEEMARNQIGDIDVPVMRSSVPAMSNDVDFFPGMTKKWGLGFLINTERAATGRSAGSLAWAGIGNTYYWIDPDKGVAGVVLMQVLPFADKAALEVLAAFETAIYRELQ